MENPFFNQLIFSSRTPPPPLDMRSLWVPPSTTLSSPPHILLHTFRVGPDSYIFWTGKGRLRLVRRQLASDYPSLEKNTRKKLAFVDTF